MSLLDKSDVERIAARVIKELNERDNDRAKQEMRKVMQDIDTAFKILCWDSGPARSLKMQS